MLSWWSVFSDMLLTIVTNIYNSDLIFDLFAMKPLEEEHEAAQNLRDSISQQSRHSEVSQVPVISLFTSKIGQEYTAYLFCALGTICWPLSFLYFVEKGFKPTEMNIVRGLCNLFVNYAIVYYYKIDISFKNPKGLYLLILRNTIMSSNALAMGLAYYYLPQPVLQTINSLGPINVLIMDYYLNGVTVTRTQFYGILLGFVGAVITINGQLLTEMLNPDYHRKSDFSYLDNSLSAFVLAAVGLYLAMVAWAYAAQLTKKIADVNSIQINLMLGFEFLLMGAIMYPGSHSVEMELYPYCMSFLLSGLVGTLASLLFITSLTLTKNTGVLTMMLF